MSGMRVLVLLACAVIPAGCRAPGGGGTEYQAVLGIRTSVPPAELAGRLGLEKGVRQSGRRIEAVLPGSPAEAAGLGVGDVLVELDGVVPFSQDDVDDVVAVHRPGDRIEATRIDPRSGERHTVLVELGRGEPAGGKGIRWQHASLAHLSDALRQARAQKKKVLVGLSGAET